MQRVQQRSTFACIYASRGCRHRPFLSKGGADGHSRTCAFAPDAARPAHECHIAVRVRPVPVRHGSAFWKPLPTPIALSIKVLRPLLLSKPYGLQRHSGVVQHQTPAARENAAATGVVRQVSVSLPIESSVSADGAVWFRARVSFKVHAVRPPPPCLAAGWAIRPPADRARYTSEQIAYLLELFDWPRGRLNETQAFALYKRKFSHAAPHAYQRSLRLSRAQIKAWFSSEKAHRLKGVSNATGCGRNRRDGGGCK